MGWGHREEPQGLIKPLRMDNFVVDGTHTATDAQFLTQFSSKACLPNVDGTCLRLRHRQVELGCVVCAEAGGDLSPMGSCAEM